MCVLIVHSSSSSSLKVHAAIPSPIIIALLVVVAEDLSGIAACVPAIKSILKSVSPAVTQHSRHK